MGQGVCGACPLRSHRPREGAKHWHGADKDSWMQHFTYHTDVKRYPSNEWLEAVDDEHYNKL